MEKIETLGPGLSDTGLDAPNPPPAGYRTVNLHLSAVDISRLEGFAGRYEVYHAIGYLSTWNQTFPVVDINPDGQSNMMAVYRHAGGEVGYVIGAILSHDGISYAFHS